jgi:hypothetical protein
MSPKIESGIAITSTILVLFSAMWDPRISVALSIFALVTLGDYRLVKKVTKYRFAISIMSF